MPDIRVGTCGYQYFDPGDSWQEAYESKLHAYSDTFRVGELNRTFYRLPQVSTAERWRREAEPGFDFVVKAWQAMTHPWSSPTWNNHRDRISEENTQDVGLLRPTSVVKEAWTEIRRRASALAADIVVIQTPPSFECSPETETSMQELFSSIPRDGIEIAWEPRGDWHENPGRIAAMCTELDLIHVVDIFRDDPLDDHPYAYIRLHGRNEYRYDYDYEYSRAELDQLASELRDLAETHDRVYCLFNNYGMYENALTLQDLLAG